MDCWYAFLENTECGHGLALIHQANHACDGCVDDTIARYERQVEPLDMFDDMDYRLMLCLRRQRGGRKRMTRDEAMDMLSIRMSDQWSHFRDAVVCSDPIDILDSAARDSLYRALNEIDRTEREIEKVANQPAHEIDYWIED